MVKQINIPFKHVEVNYIFSVIFLMIPIIGLYLYLLVCKLKFLSLISINWMVFLVLYYIQSLGLKYNQIPLLLLIIRNTLLVSTLVILRTILLNLSFIIKYTLLFKS